MSGPVRLEPIRDIPIPDWTVAILAAARSISLLLLPGLLVLSAVSSGEGQDTRPRVHLFIRGPEIVVKISLPTPLNIVMDELCQKTNTVCEGTGYASSFSVAAMELRGHWDGIVSKLLGGTQLNYISSAGTSEYPGRLIVYSVSSGAPAPSGSGGIKLFRDEVQQATNQNSGSEDQHAGIQNSVVEPAENPVADSASTGGDSYHQASNRPFVYLGSFSGTGELQPRAQNESGAISQNPFTGEIVTPVARQTPASPISGIKVEGHISTEPVQYLPIPDANGKLVPIPR